VTFQLRAATPADRDAVRRLVTTAFGAGRSEHGEDVGRLVDLLDASGRTLHSFVAETDGKLVGHVQLSRSWVDARERLVEVAVLSPLSTLPAYERRGIGSALVSAALDAARAAGEPAVFLEGDPDFYGRRGFVRGDTLGFTRPSVRIPQPAFQVALFDGEMPRGALAYCDAFWALDCVGLRDPRLSEVEAHLGS
jgi:putative acetyltransferase